MFFKTVTVMDARRLLGLYGVLGMIRRGFLPRALAINFAKQRGVNFLSVWMRIALIPGSNLVAKRFKKTREAYHAFEFHFGYLIDRCLGDAILPNATHGNTMPLSPTQFDDLVMRGIGSFAEMSVIALVTYGDGTCQLEVARARLKGVLEQALAAGLIKSDKSEPYEAEAIKRLRVYIERQALLDHLRGKPEVILPSPVVEETSPADHPESWT